MVNISTLEVLEKCCQDIPVNNDLSYSKAEIINAPRIDDETSVNETYFDEEGFVKPEKQVYVERLLANLNPDTGKPYERHICSVETE